MAFRFLQSGEEVTAELTYADLDRRARAIAAALRSSCAPGDRALLVLPGGLEFITAFFGCLYAGVVAVPAYPPRANESVRRLRAIVADAGARVALTTWALLAASKNLTPENLGGAHVALLAVDEMPDELATAWCRPEIGPDTLALLQYTSGSTGEPKGVMLTHRALLTNQEMIRRIYRHDNDAVIGGWLPLFHDMGLIGVVMQSLFLGGRGVLMPPAAFLQRPLRWLQMVSRHGIVTTGAPNFAFELCARRITPEERAGLDLSGVRNLFNGSEPIQAATLVRFAETFAPCGLRREALLPCYGMAEASLLVTGKTAGRAPVIAEFSAKHLEAGAAAELDSAAGGEARRLVSSGRAAAGVTLAIVDPESRRRRADGEIGEIWVRGANIGSGYWNKPELSAATFGATLPGGRAQWLRTGDLGFLRDGELFVTGRSKDLIIVRGRNLYPQDIEATAQAAHAALRPAGAAAFAVEAAGTEGIVVVIEVERTALRVLDAGAVTQAVRDAILRDHEIAPVAIVLVKPATLPKTSSGKIQRGVCREQFLTGALEPVGRWRAEIEPGIAPASKTEAHAVSSVAALESWLVERVAAALQRESAAIDRHAPLQSLGLDSMAAVALSGELEVRLGRPVSPTIVYEWPTIAALAQHFGADGEAARKPAGSATETKPSATDDPDARAIAVVGIGCRFPGGADTPAAFWSLLQARRDAVGEIPRTRWNVDAFYDANPETPGRMYVRNGAFLEAVDGFDADFFAIAPREAVGMDPQHRLLLEVAWEALEDAAIAPAALVGGQTGVFVGVSGDDYARLAAAAGEAVATDAHAALGTTRALAAARISYHLGLRGPSMLVDTLCSSSLLAVHLAMQSLRARECRVALAGGANLMLAPEATIASCKLRALAPDGRCKTFDAAADGYARGEGAGIVVLKRLRDAQADGDPILAVLRGSAVNHDGRSNGLTAPSATAQEALLRQALGDAGVAAGDVNFVEAHGTGTVLGDPIEVQALHAVYGEGRPAENPLLLGAVKTNIGHLEAAAGIAGLIKTILALRAGELPANLHFQIPNPYIPWDRLPLRVLDQPVPWPAGRRLAGVSSFGLGGTNVHVVVEAAPEPAQTGMADGGEGVFRISGHTVEAALANAQRWAEFLAAHPELPLADICHTADVGRNRFAHAAEFSVRSVAELARRLHAVTAADFRRSGPPAEADLAPVAPGRRVGGLPTYAFQRRRTWLDIAPPGTDATEQPAVPTYAIRWHEEPRAPDGPAGPERGEWLLVGCDKAAASVVAAALREHGQEVRSVEDGGEWSDPRIAAFRGVILLEPTPLQAFAAAQGLVRLESVAVAAGATQLPRLWLLTRRSVAVGNETAAIDLASAPLAGFARAFALEHPERWGGHFDGDEVDAAAAAAFVRELLTPGDDDTVAWRNGRRWVPRLEPRALPATGRCAFRTDATYFVTGGTGGIGRALVRWLVDRGARHVAVLSRRAPNERLRREFDALAGRGARVYSFSGDVADASQLESVLAEIDRTLPPLLGVFHAAGVAGFAPLGSITPEQFTAVLAPKVDGARRLHELMLGRPLEHFVLFSSIASVWGSTGQVHYAAANAGLDALAHERRRLGLPALSLNWGPWDEAGMAVTAREQLRRIGIAPIASTAALELLAAALGAGEPQVVAAAVDWKVLHPVLSLRRARPLTAGLAVRGPAAAAEKSEVLTRLRQADPTQRGVMLASFLQRQLAGVLGRDAGETIDAQQGFFALGMDSLMAVELRARLEAELQIKLPSTIAFDRATLAALHAEVAALLFPAAVATSTPPAMARSSARAEPIAIVGLGCRFPGGVATPEQFWELLREGRNGAKPVPAGRWDADAFFHPEPGHAGTMYVREFGFVDGVDRFDHGFFNVYPREAASMDPQQRLLLETTWEALESAGWANERLRGSDTGVFVGVSTNDYGQLLVKAGDPARIDAYFGTGNALNAIAGRLAYTFGLRGPTLVTDTACSSSLVALHQACGSLRAGECTQAIVAGVNLILTPEPTIALSRARMLAPDGRCKTFDAAADGYGRGEGCGVVLVKRLSDAQAAGDPILAVIAGSAVNQDGASSGFTVPSGSAQQELIRRALAQARRLPEEVDYIEAHGTGTPLGDPIELHALGAALGIGRTRPLLVGSVKTNLGHLEAAAGIAGVIKTVLALQRAQVPAHVNFTHPSPHIGWRELPLEVPVRLTRWPETPGRPRVAGVSAFGFTGTNAHVVLESAPVETARPTAARVLHLVPLSARSAEALAALRQNVREWLDAKPQAELVDVARTLGAGRLHQPWREVYVVGAIDELRRQLAQALPPAAAVPATPRPVAFVCRDAAAREIGTAWLRWGLAPERVVGEGAGLIAAGAVAGVFSNDDAARLEREPAAIESVSLHAPCVALGHARAGRVPDALAASRAWWRSALAGDVTGASEFTGEVHFLALDQAGEAERLRTAAALYLAGYRLDWEAITAVPGARHLPDAPRYPFQRSRHWIDVTPAVSTKPIRRGLAALLGERLALPGAKEVRFAAEYSAAAPALLDHHRLFGSVIAPAAQHISLLVSAGRQALGADGVLVSGLTFPAALRLAENASRSVQLVLTPDDKGVLSARLLGAPVEPADEWTLHASGRVSRAVGSAPPWPLAAEFERVPVAVTRGEFYGALESAGYTLGPSFRWVEAVEQGSGGARGVLQPPPGACEPGVYDVHPGLLDSCFQLLGWCAGVQRTELGDGAAIYIPAAVEAVRFHRRPTGARLQVEVRVTAADYARTHRLRGDIRLLDTDGALVLEVRGFEARRAPRALLVGAADEPAAPAKYFRVGWTESPRPVAAVIPGTASWCVIGAGGVALALAERLRARGHEVALDPLPGAGATGVVVFLEDDDPSAAPAAQVLTLVQTLVALERKPRLWIVTRGAQVVAGDHGAVPVGAAAAVAVGRIAALEHPELQPVLIDLDPAYPQNEDAVLEEELFAATDENQVAWRGARRLVARLTGTAPAPRPDPQPVRLRIRDYGNLDTFELARVERQSPAAGQVEIEVRAAGVNFRDVLNALGVLRPHVEALGVGAAAELPLGGECAGVVSAVGAGVKHVQPGDRVVAVLATGCMASHVTLPARFVTALPEGFSFAEAATLPVAYVTAHYALRELAGLRRGERVLIHAAAGGVGLAAVQIARRAGAEICATASVGKWPALQKLGVTQLANSRTTAYAGEFTPVDVVLNCLTGEHIPRSLELLAPGGRFVEIGKRDIWTAEQVAAKRPDVAYHAFDLVEISRHAPELIGRLLGDVAAEWRSGGLPALPLRSFALEHAAAAFRFMSQARHIGKLVLVRPPGAAPRPRRDGVYLVTGGGGGLGLAVAGWLARAGAGTIVLASRRGPTPAHAETLAAMRAAGARVVWQGIDLAQPEAAAALVHDVATEFGPLRGVFHAAGVLDDGVMAEQTPARLAAVYAPKAAAAWQLDQATRGQPLDYFVLFSSLAAVLGSPGQSTYAAANAALDALAEQRRRLGLPALSVNWGPWAGVGMAARLGERERARLAALGLRSLAGDEALTRLGEVLASAETQIAIAELDPGVLLQPFAGGRVPPLLRGLGTRTAVAGEGASSLLTELRAATAEERGARLLAALQARLASGLGLSGGEALPHDRPLGELGLDSLMAVELKGWIATELRVDVPMQQVATFTLPALAGFVLRAAALESEGSVAGGETVAADEAAVAAQLRADAVLPAEIQIPTPTHRATREAVRPLLTGATGFLGAFLLHELLGSAGAERVYCLVRASDAAEGGRRVVENLRAYGLPTRGVAERIVIVCGDLAQPRLGLSERGFDELAATVDAIYHNGAWLNFFYGYEALRPANVLGTAEVLRLAARGGATPVHYVSTSGVFYSRAYRGRARPETDPAEHCEGHVLGYSQSKWVAERLVAAAGERGLPVTIHRAPFITGHAASGAWNADDFICRLVRGIAALGAMPDLAASMDIVPVDYVARGIVRASRQGDAAGRRFHWCARNVVPWTALAGWLAENGVAVQRESYATWVARLREVREATHPLAPFAPLFLERGGAERPTVPEVFLQTAHARLDGAATAAWAASALQLEAPEIDGALWRTYLAALASQGLLATTAIPR